MYDCEQKRNDDEGIYSKMNNLNIDTDTHLHVHMK
jgi:hypothetical protein